MIKFLLAIFALSNTHIAIANQCVQISNWKFRSMNSEGLKPVMVGISLTDPIQNLTSFGGLYETDLVSSQLAQFTNPAIYIPAIGGLKGIVVADSSVILPRSDYAGVGPVFGVPSVVKSGAVSIKVEVIEDLSSYSGIWKGAPLLCESEVAQQLQSRDKLWQQTVPNIMAVLCLGLAVLFYCIYRYTNRKVGVYFLFSGAMLVWALFFASLSGFYRELFYQFGTNSIYAFRIAASFGLLLLLYSYRPSGLGKLDRIMLWAAAALVVPASYFAVNGNITLQLYCLTASLFTQIPVVISLVVHGRSTGKAFFTGALTLVTFLGEMSDLLKLIGPQVGLVSPLPYLARISVPPVLLISAAFFLWNFVGYYRNTRLNNFRHKTLGKIALEITQSEVSEQTLTSVARMSRRLLFTRRSSMAKRCEDGSYKIIRMFGAKSDYTGASINLSKNIHIQKCIDTGSLQVEYIQGGDIDPYKNGFSLAAPVPLKENPDYIVFLSDSKENDGFGSDAVNVCHQLFSSLSSAYIGKIERQKRELKEEEFKNLVRKLDPNLYEFIRNNIDKGAVTVDETCERGIIFFDQKSFTTMLEKITADQAAIALSFVKKWLSESVFRQNARIKGFFGDAFIVEVFPLPGETRNATIARTLRVAWELNEGVDLLNREFIKSGFNTVSYRFGAHFGVAANVDIGLIEAGTQSLVGDTVNLSQRIQSYASVGTVLVSDALVESSQDDFVFEEIKEKKYVKGRTGIVRLYRLIGHIKKENVA